MSIYKILFFCTILCFQLSELNAQARFEFSETSHNFGEVLEGSEATHEFHFKNIGNTPLIIRHVRASCGCTTPYWTKDPIPPGKSGSITATYNSKNRPGNFNKSITITSNADEPNKVLSIKGQVIRHPNAIQNPTAAQMALTPLIKIEKQVYELGNVGLGQTIPIVVPIKNEGKSRLTIVNITASCKCVRLAASAKRIFQPGESATTEILFSPTSLGSMDQEVIIESTDLKHPKTSLTIKAAIMENLGDNSIIKNDKTIKF
ncbi:DUF1573 domain-containing protein [Fulvivirgaceae bacterium BMA12]|uniref:DUF1573 domain-containing protein n=1 Tax=Agaribacillus aureus TaxID=3051825 RepID=A0ABT8L337_9BACT|nr:DUF1573 domain-containing protein [Fulvivirgaceae bacterium BMA12]